MSRWEVEMSDGSKRVVEAASEQDALAMAAGASGSPDSAPAQTSPPSPSALDLMKRGAARAPGNLMQFAARGMNAVENMAIPTPQGGQITPFSSLFGGNTEAMVNAPWDEAAEETHRRVFGGEMAPAGEGFGGKFAESLGGGLATPVPLPPGGGTIGGLAIEGAGMLAGTAAGAAADEAGLPWWASLPLSVGASMAPSMAGRVVGNRIANAPARAAADEAVEGMALRSRSAPDLLPSSARPGTIQRAASEFKTMIPRGFEDDAAQRLDDVIEMFPDPTARPTTSQALNELGGETVEGATASLSRGDRTVSRNIAGQKLRAVNAIDDEFSALQPVGDFPTAQLGFDDAAEAARLRERAAWAAVPMDQMPMVPSRSLKQAADEIAASVGQAGAGNLPDEFRVIAQYENVVPFSELQSLRSELLAVERAGRSGTASARSMRQGAHAARLRQHVDALIDDVAENSQVTGQPLTPGTSATVQRQEGVTALRDAQRITRENREMFDPRSPVVRAFEHPRESKDIANGLLRGGPQDARRALSMFRQNQAAQDSVRRIVMDELIGPDILTEGAARSALKRLRDKRQTAVSLFGPEHVQNVERLLRKAQTVRSGRAGTRAGALGTGSNTLPAHLQMAKEAAQDVIGQRGMTFGDVVTFIPKQARAYLKGLKDADFSRVMAAAVVDPELARDLLRIPGPAALPKWATRMEGHLVRNGIRLVPQIGSGVEE